MINLKSIVAVVLLAGNALFGLLYALGLFLTLAEGSLDVITLFVGFGLGGLLFANSAYFFVKMWKDFVETKEGSK